MIRSNGSSAASASASSPSRRHDGRMAPCLERRAHVVQDVRLVVHDQHAEAAGRRRRCRTPAAARRGRAAERQLHREGRAFALLGGEHDAPPVLLHDSLADREPEPGAFAFRLGGEERLEHLGRERLRHAGPVVDHVDGHAVEPAAGAHQDQAGPAGAGDRLRGVVDQVDEDLLDLVRVDLGHAAGRPRSSIGPRPAAP